MSLRDPLAAVATFAFSLAAFLMAGRFGGGAELFPRGITAVMMVFSVILFVRGLRGQRAEAVDGEAEGGEPLRVGLAVALTVAYVALIVPAGFFVASIVYIPATAYLLGLRNHLMIWLATAIVIGVIYVLFERVFHTPLPAGRILPILAGS